MLYHLLFPLRDYFIGFNVFRYITFRMSWATICAFLLSIIVGPMIIRWLRKKQIGQFVRDDGPQSHFSKQGTPTMGGVLIVMSVVVVSLLWCRLDNLYVWLVLFVAVSFGLVGFMDDYRKVIRKRSKGLSAKEKMLALIVCSLCFSLILYFSNAWGYDFRNEVRVPFLKVFAIHLGWGFVIFSMLVLVGSGNAVNLTDGLDGLAIGIMVVCAGVYIVFAYVCGHIEFSRYLQITYVSGAGELAIICGALFGSGLGFLWFNSHPAEIFMGDVGALSLGGTIGAVAVITKQELLLLIVGGIFVMEAVSVILQVGSYKLRKKRIFKMAPIHHHFELKGWPEAKVIVRFWIIAIILGLIALSALKLR